MDLIQTLKGSVYGATVRSNSPILGPLLKRFQNNLVISLNISRRSSKFDFAGTSFFALWSRNSPYVAKSFTKYVSNFFFSYGARAMLYNIFVSKYTFTALRLLLSRSTPITIPDCYHIF